ncbi:hypothetical protein [Rubellicoccus peritrichatus]|uniref:DUF4375 domain-containing protein n=1 Tax=Rubellicoccus peritrichatus TaxID=3080537 RepID=A0AAQ3L5A7_9BACT|nr:hypothetical protein [Puniceicoccus sp. CR14]WOO39674.1 hypothetical protein RZN69_13710 [Puniceicoccus sp. CR14]
MKIHILIILFVIVFGRLGAESESVMLSPVLTEYLAENPKMNAVASKILREGIGDWPVEVFYFYSNDESRARAFHTVARERKIFIFIRENQSAYDQFLCLLYEALNATSQPKFQKVVAEASKGNISAEAFAESIMQIEHGTTMRVQDILRKLSPSESDKEDSYLHNRIINCPADYEASREYTKRVSPNRDLKKEYIEKYHRAFGGKNEPSSGADGN